MIWPLSLLKLPLTSLEVIGGGDRERPFLCSLRSRARRLFVDLVYFLKAMDSGLLTVLTLFWLASFGIYFAGHVLFALLTVTK